jgi:hypothetical protein
MARARLIPEIELDGGHVSYSISAERASAGLRDRASSSYVRRGSTQRPGVRAPDDPSRVGSIGVIERDGGQLLDRPKSPFTGEQLPRFAVPADTAGAAQQGAAGDA